jgi:hypothetical protein
MMSEKLFRLLLAELSKITIRCTQPNCTGVVEMNVERIQSLKRPLACPACGAIFTHDTSLADLSRAIDAVKTQEQKDHFQVEFTIVDPDK